MVESETGLPCRAASSGNEFSPTIGREVKSGCVRLVVGKSDAEEETTKCNRNPKVRTAPAAAASASIGLSISTGKFLKKN